VVSRLGRFGSPDKHSGSLSNPQSLNRYIYALDDPINLSDPSGLDAYAANRCWFGNSQDGAVEDGGDDAAQCQADGGAWYDGDTWTFMTGTTSMDVTNSLSVYLDYESAGETELGDILDSLSDFFSGPDSNPSIDYGAASPEEIANDPLHQLFTNNANNPHGGDIINGTSQFVNASAAIPVVMIGGAVAAPEVLGAGAVQEVIPVIGRLADTAAFIDLPGFEVFTQEIFSPAANFAWIQANIQAGNAFLLVSSITELNMLNSLNESGFSGFGEEVSQILGAGYQWVGGFLVPGR
jgi:hypothetical protein